MKIVEPGSRSPEEFVKHPRYRIYVYGCSPTVYDMSLARGGNEIDVDSTDLHVELCGSL